MRGLGLGAAVLLALALAPRTATAQGQSCRIGIIQGVSFTAYDPFASADVAGVGTIEHRCSAPRLPRIWLGTGNAATFTPRQMWLGGTDSSEILLYDLCRDVQCTMIWGDGSQGTHEYVATTARAVVEVYGRVRAGQDPIVGSYSDVVTITLLF